MRSALVLACCNPWNEISGPPPSPIASTKAAKAGSSAFQMGVMRQQIVKFGQIAECEMLALITSAFVPLRITGHVWRKSPSKTTTFPPNGKEECMIFWQVSSTQARTAQLAIGASSQIIRLDWWISAACESVDEIGDSSISLRSFIGT